MECTSNGGRGLGGRLLYIGRPQPQHKRAPAANVVTRDQSVLNQQ